MRIKSHIIGYSHFLKILQILLFLSYAAKNQNINDKAIIRNVKEMIIFTDVPDFVTKKFIALFITKNDKKMEAIQNMLRYITKLLNTLLNFFNRKSFSFSLFGIILSIIDPKTMLLNPISK